MQQQVIAMIIQQKLGISYLIALSITIFLGIIDSDPITSHISFLIDILIMSWIIWTLIIIEYATIHQLSILVKRVFIKSKK